MMDPNLVILLIAVLNAFTAFMAWRTHSLTKQVEIATNSMKDALVKATGDAARAEGREEERIAGEAKVADATKGVLSVLKEK